MKFGHAALVLSVAMKRNGHDANYHARRHYVTEETVNAWMTGTSRPAVLEASLISAEYGPWAQSTPLVALWGYDEEDLRALRLRLERERSRDLESRLNG